MYNDVMLGYGIVVSYADFVVPFNWLNGMDEVGYWLRTKPDNVICIDSEFDEYFVGDIIKIGSGEVFDNDITAAYLEENSTKRIIQEVTTADAKPKLMIIGMAE